MRNNNRAIVRNLSKRSFLANKSRNVFALIAVVLTTVLITELAMLQSVGMTAKQGKKMLVLESIDYMALALFVFVTAGYAVSYFAVNTVTQGSAAYTYQFSFVPLVTCFPILLILACVLPTRVYKSISRDSVVQRLRENE